MPSLPLTALRSRRMVPHSTVPVPSLTILEDAFAILLAAYHDRFHLLGVSTVYGNAPLSKTTNNALSVLQAIGKADVPVHVGKSTPLIRNISTAPDIHGESGLDGTDLLPQPKRKPLLHCNALQDMRDAIMSCPPNTAWLIATGPLTNAVLVLETFPEVLIHLSVLIMVCRLTVALAGSTTLGGS